MKVCSVNVDSRLDLHNMNQLAYKKLEAVLHRHCTQLLTPDDELCNVFQELSKSTINKTPCDSITVKPGGVIGDRHFRPNWIECSDGIFYNVSKYSQISILTKERYCELNQLYKTNVQAGEFGENILIEGLLDIEMLPPETILQFGKTAQIKITHLRSCCFKFENVIFPTVGAYFNWKKSLARLGINKIGVLGQVIAEGVIRPNDSITIVHAPTSNARLRYIQRPHGVVSRTPFDPPTNS